MANQPLYRELMQQQLHYLPIFRGWISSHLPMVLTALQKMSATNEQLQEVYDRTTNFLEPTPNDVDTLDINNIKDHLGDHEKYIHYYQYFLQRIQQESPKAVVSDSIKQLLPGVSTSAFHGLIRLGYAVDSNEPEEIAAALAFWSSYHHDLSVPVVMQDIDIAESLSLAKAQLVDVNIETSSISERIRYVEPQFTEIALPCALTWTTLVEFLAHAHYGNNNFTILHSLTATHALKTVSDWLEEPLSLSDLWRAIVLGLLTTEIPLAELLELHPVVENTNGDWPTLLNAAQHNLGDSHTIKFAYSCWQLDQQVDLPILYQCTQQKVERSQ